MITYKNVKILRVMHNLYYVFYPHITFGFNSLEAAKADIDCYGKE